MHFFFTYSLFKRNTEEHFLLENSALITAKAIITNSGIFMIKNTDDKILLKGKHKILGELYEVTESTLLSIESYFKEHKPNFMKKEIIVSNTYHTQMNAFCYTVDDFDISKDNLIEINYNHFQIIS